jgi:tRNA (guanine37-N1)-methyltransferase
MHIDIITIFPEMFEDVFRHSIVKRALEKGAAEIELHNLRDHTTNRHKSVDDYPYGGGSGMVMMIEPIDRCIATICSKRKVDEVIYLTPDGELLEQPLVNRLSMLENIILLCGHYKGVDERVRESLITREISIGDYVLSGGELPAMVFCDSVIRLLPGVLGDETSALSDSFQDGLLAPPVYTRPASYKGMKVPGVLLSGNDKEIAQWRHEKAVERTEKKRPRLLDF